MTTSPERLNPLAPGNRLDRYELLCPVAEGGMASVWIGRLSGKHGFEKLVAIKTILPKHASDERFQRMFLDEARIASRIDHANVCQILDLGEENEILYLVMEWIDGDALSRINRLVRKAGLVFPPALALRILSDTCDGLHAAHELRAADGSALGVVHRDVSPQNILVTARGVAKLIDFGIAKARDRLSGETSAGSLKGKVQYMAPEQATGKPVDRRSDVWGVGAVLYHLLAGRVAYEAENDLGMLHALMSGAPPPPLPPNIPSPVASVVLRALAHDPSGRFETTQEMRTAIENAMSLTGLSATTGDVAAFLAQHLGAHADARRRAIEAGIAAAGAKLPLDAVVARASTGSGSGSGSGSGAGSAPALEVDSLASGAPPLAERTAAMLPRTGPPLAAPATAAPPEASAPLFASDVASGNGSLGLASTSSAVSVRPPAKRGVIVLAIAAALFASIGGGLIFVSLRAASSQAASQTAMPPAAAPSSPPAASVAVSAAAPQAIADPPSAAGAAAAAPAAPPTATSASARTESAAPSKTVATVATVAAPPKAPALPKAAVAVTAPSRPVVAPPPATSARRRHVDDGF